MTKYNVIGSNYNSFRNADVRISTCLKELLNLDSGAIIADIGAGTGNYTQALAASGYTMKAVEPSDTMRAQAARHPEIEWFAGFAEALPLSDNSVNGVMSTLANHHFQDMTTAASEMCRICPNGPIVLFTIDPRKGESFWFAEYFPGVYRRLFDSFRALEELVTILQNCSGKRVDVTGFPLPADLTDLNMHAGWNKPEIYLDEAIRAGMSGLALTDKAEVDRGLDYLRGDLDSGKWDKHYGHLRTLERYDLGFVFVKVAA